MKKTDDSRSSRHEKTDELEHESNEEVISSKTENNESEKEKSKRSPKNDPYVDDDVSFSPKHEKFASSDE